MNAEKKTQSKAKSKTSVLRIRGEMNIYRAAELKQTLLEPLEQPGALDVDLSGVTELDTAGVQILMLAKKTALAKGRELHLIAHSQPVLEVFELLNLAAYFGDQLVISSPQQRV